MCGFRRSFNGALPELKLFVAISSDNTTAAQCQVVSKFHALRCDTRKASRGVASAELHEAVHNSDLASRPSSDNLLLTN